MPTAVSILLTAGLALLDIKKSMEIQKIAIVKDKTVTKIEHRTSLFRPSQPPVNY